eukprot:104359_1
MLHMEIVMIANLHRILLVQYALYVVIILHLHQSHLYQQPCIQQLYIQQQYIQQQTTSAPTTIYPTTMYPTGVPTANPIQCTDLGTCTSPAAVSFTVGVGQTKKICGNTVYDALQVNKAANQDGRLYVTLTTDCEGNIFTLTNRDDEFNHLCGGAIGNIELIAKNEGDSSIAFELRCTSEA